LHCPGTFCSIDLMVGLRYLNLDTDVEIGQETLYNTNLSAHPEFKGFEGNRIQSRESFTSSNNFWGGQVGVRSKLYFEKLILESFFKYGLGTTFEEVNVEGFQLRTMPNGTTTLSKGALLALPTNIGKHHQEKIAQVPEMGFKLSYPVLK